MYIFIGIILAIIGLVMIIFPRTFYQFTQSWKNDTSSEPSHIYVIGTKFGGIMVTIVGVLSIIAQFL